MQLAAFPPPAGDAEFLAVCSSLGLTDERTPYADPSPELRALLVEAERSGRETIDALMTGGADLVNGWREAAHLFDYNLDFFEVGTIDAPEWKIADRTTAYATRAVAARAGLWGNHGYEADYFITAMDADGDQLSGAHTYELRLENYEPVTNSFTVEEGFKLEFKHELKPLEAQLEVFSRPTGAKIWINNMAQAQATPARFTLLPGSYLVSVHHPVFDRYIGKRIIIVKVHPDTRQVWAHDDRPVTYKTNRAGRRVVDSDPSCIQSIYGFDQLRLIT